MCTCIHLSTCTYKEREKGREREGEREGAFCSPKREKGEKEG